MTEPERTPTNITPNGDLEIHTFIGEHDPSWGSPLLGQVSFIRGVDMSGTDDAAYEEYKSACSLLYEKRLKSSKLRAL